MPKVKAAAFLCPHCGLPTTVLRTRTSDGAELTRYRICESGHRTTTREMIASTIFEPMRLALREVMNGSGPKQISIDNHSHGDSNNEFNTNSSR